MFDISAETRSFWMINADMLDWVILLKSMPCCSVTKTERRWQQFGNISVTYIKLKLQEAANTVFFLSQTGRRKNRRETISDIQHKHFRKKVSKILRLFFLLWFQVPSNSIITLKYLCAINIAFVRCYASLQADEKYYKLLTELKLIESGSRQIRTTARVGLSDVKRN